MFHRMRAHLGTQSGNEEIVTSLHVHVFASTCSLSTNHRQLYYSTIAFSAARK